MVDTGAPERLRVLVAPDKFKGSLNATEAAEAIAAGVHDAIPDATITLRPIADGGEGTLETFAAAGAAMRHARVTGPLGAVVAARWATWGQTAVIELAEAAGLRLVPALGPENASRADTRGVGELVSIALEEGFRDIIIAVGGSASTDGGFGAMRELGLRVLDAAGAGIGDVQRLTECAALDTTALDARLAECRIVIATDVTSPLTGRIGAARMFASQKGADEQCIAALEQRLTAWGRLLDAHAGSPVSMNAGTGAAGGFAFPFLALGCGEVRSGADEIAAVLVIAEAVHQHDIVVIGEGSLDEQSLLGKGPIAMARLAADAGALVAAVCGRSTLNSQQRSEAGIDHLQTILELAPNPEAAFTHAATLLRTAASRAIAEAASVVPS